MWIEVSTTAECRHGPVRAAPRRGAPHHALTLGGAFADASLTPEWYAVRTTGLTGSRRCFHLPEGRNMCTFGIRRFFRLGTDFCRRSGWLPRIAYCSVC